MLLYHIVVNELKCSHSDTQTGHIMFMGTDGHTFKTTRVLQNRLEAILCFILGRLSKLVALCIAIMISVSVSLHTTAFPVDVYLYCNYV